MTIRLAMAIETVFTITIDF